jgi:hypothetical protein
MTSQNPISFISEMKLNNLNLKYFNLKEIVQGGPEVGNICIDNRSKYKNGPVHIVSVKHIHHCKNINVITGLDIFQQPPNSRGKFTVQKIN